MGMGALGGSSTPLGLDTPGQEPGRRPGPFDVITRLVVPLGFLVVAILQLDQRGWTFWAPLGLALISFVIGIYHPLLKPAIAAVERWRARRRDRRRVREALSDFESFVQRFGRFVDRDLSGTDDLLSKIVERRIRKENITDAKTLGITDERIFRGFWSRLHRRLEGQNPNPDRIVDAVEEFNYLVNQFLRETVVPVFDQIPEHVRPDLPDRAKRDLNDYRERLLRLRDPYNEFARDLAESLDTYELHAPHLPRPKEHP